MPENRSEIRHGVRHGFKAGCYFCGGAGVKLTSVLPIVCEAQGKRVWGQSRTRNRGTRVMSSSVRGVALTGVGKVVCEETTSHVRWATRRRNDIARQMGDEKQRR